MIPKKMEPQVWFWSVSQKIKKSCFNSKPGFANQTHLWFWITWSETSGLLPTNSGSRPFFPPK